MNSHAAVPLKWRGVSALVRTDSPLSGIPAAEIGNELVRLLAGAEILKDEPQVLAGVARHPAGPALFIKQYRNATIGQMLRSFMRVSRPMRSWRASIALEKAGVPIPRVHAAVTRRIAGFINAAFLVSKAIKDPTPDDTFFALALSDDVFEAFAHKLADILARAHAAGVAHGDAKLTNFYFSHWRRGLQSCSVGLWDLDSAWVGRKVPDTFAAEDFGRAAAALAEKAIILGSPQPLERIVKAIAEGRQINPAQIKFHALHHLRRKGLTP